MLSETDALGNTVEYAYTPEGWLSTITKADGTVLTFVYDKTGNLLIQNTGENQSIESSYNEIGQVTTVTSPEGTITYQYNQQGYLVSVTNVNGDVVSYTYDQYGNKTSMTYPDGRVVSYTYDSMNRMTSVTGLDGEVTTYAYDAAGRRVETASRNLTTEYKYDVVGSLVEQTTTGSSNLSFQYSYNLNGYITGEVRTENGETITSAYAYDPLGELVSFTQSTGYGEQYTYDKVGNMTQKVITPLGSVPNEKGTVENAVILKMKYNKANQLVSMTNGSSKITYKYDKNGSMVEKALTSKQYGTLTDTYAYNSLDQLVSYSGYDGYQQQFAYDANGMRLSKSEYGNSNRSTLEELLRGEIAGLPEVVVPVAASEDEAAVPAEYEWATTEYLYDITQEYYQVIQQTTTTGNNTTTTAYAYGLERIAAYDANNTTQYIYDGRGSVAQTISAPVAGASVSAALPDVQVHSYSYTAFGEQMGVKVSCFGYNAEDFDAGTGMINLRMRQYEPTLNRFSQKDVYPSTLLNPTSFNRYLFTYNSPISFIDANGMVPVALGNAAASVRDGATGVAKKSVIQSVAKSVATLANNVKTAVQNTVKNYSKQADAKLIRSIASNRDITSEEFQYQCSKIFGKYSDANDVADIIRNINALGGLSQERANDVNRLADDRNLEALGLYRQYEDLSTEKPNRTLIEKILDWFIPTAYAPGLSYVKVVPDEEFYPLEIDNPIEWMKYNMVLPIEQMVEEDWNAMIYAGNQKLNSLKGLTFAQGVGEVLFGWIPDTINGVSNHYASLYSTYLQNRDTSSLLNWLSSGVSGKFETTWNTPMNDPAYWRATRDLIGLELTVLGMGKLRSYLDVKLHPHTTEWMIRYTDQMGVPYGSVPAGTFDDVSSQVPTLIQNSDKNYLFDRYEIHVFSHDHINEGIMDLGANRTEIMNSGYSCIVEAAQQGLLVEGSNQIRTHINGMEAEIKLYIQNDVITSFDMYKGWSTRTIYHAVYLGGE